MIKEMLDIYNKNGILFWDDGDWYPLSPNFDKVRIGNAEIVPARVRC